MLVLSRKVGEKLVIGDGITVVINRISGNRVSVGVEAPVSVKIVRGELAPLAEGPSEQPSTPLGCVTGPTFDLSDVGSLHRAR